MQSLNATEARETGAHADTLGQPKAIGSFPFARLRRWYRNSVLRLLLREMCNSTHRIRWIVQIHAADRLRGQDSVRTWMDGALIPPPRTRQRAYIDHMQQTEKDHPLLSIFDLMLLSKAWRSGSEWRDRSQDISRNPDSTHSS